MRKFHLMLAFCAFLLASCSSETDVQMPAGRELSSSKEFVLTRSSVPYETLSFDSQESLESALSELRSLKSNQEKSEWVKANYPDFTSIQDVYADALVEADKLGDTEEEMVNFMEKYNGLYFPMEGEDAGFYIPMTDLDLAFLVNPNYEIEVGGKIMPCADVKTYSDLYALGRTFYNEQPSLLADNYTEFTFEASLKNFSQAYESGWRTNESGKRKINLKMDRQLQSVPVPPHAAGDSKLHIEISFRKHTWVGWINYSTTTTVKGEVNLAGGPKITLDYSNKGTSSHDDWIPCPVKISFANPAYVATFPKITGNMTIDLEAFPTMSYTFSMNGAFCKIRDAGYVIPTF